MISAAISSALRSLPRQTPGSPWMPMPISISSSAISKVGLPACGTVQDVSAAPMERQASAAFWPTRVTSFQVETGLGGRAGDLEGIDHAGHAAALLGLFRLGAGHVVGQDHRGRGDVLHLHDIAGHVEVHDVAAVVAVEAQHAPCHPLAARMALGHFVGRRRGEDVADGAGVEQALADVAGEDRQVAGTAAGDDADLALDRERRRA